MERAGISLRKKRSVRPKISAPISAPIGAPISSQSSLPPPSEESLQRPQRPKLSPSPQRSQDGSKERERPPLPRENTADYVKRRYSTHLTKIPKDFADAPAVPAIPGQFAPNGSPSPSRAPRPPAAPQKIEVDLKALEDPHLRPDQYVAQLLANASEQEIRDYQNDLGRVRHRTSTDIQHNVHQNRNQFIKISQEAEKLKGEMRALRNLMSELTTTLGQTNAALGIETDAPSSRKHAKRSSVANLEAMWSTHLHELWRRVEGSQKYLPAIPGRHVVHESGRWVELNTATWRPYRRVHLILLNDYLLIAAEKRRPEQASPQVSENSKPKAGPAQTQLVAERCWPLQDIEIKDLAASDSGPSKIDKKTGNQLPTANAFNVRVGSETFTYATTDKSNSEKTALLTKFRKAQTELRRALQGDTDDRHDTPNQRPLSANAKDILTNGAAGSTESTATKADVLVEVDGRQQNFRWVETQVDELDIDIALQRFEDAVERVEQLRRIAKSNKSNAVVQELVDGKVQERAAKLARAITRQISEKHSSMTITKQYVTWLSKLGFEVRASEAYLDARSAVIRTRTGQCADEGSLHHYLYQISFIYFTLIRNTISIYQSCFVPSMASFVIKWAKDHVDEFNVILAQQLGQLEPGSEERDMCLQTARDHAVMLQEVGVDFRNIVGRGL